jgi:F420-dependent oxidoreductase-like protein
LKVGLQLPNFGTSDGASAIAPRLRDIAEAAEAGRFASLWVMDHYFQIPGVGEAEEPMLEGYATLAHLAAATSTIALGTLVTGVTYREPAVLVKTATTLDVLSGGRSYFGVGAAWFEREHQGLGVAFPAIAERFERLEETLRIAKQMWSGDVGSFEGRHYQLRETLCVPRPIARPHPPILIGGGGETKTLRLVARYGDACNLFAGIGVSEVARKLDVLKAHCADVGRPYEEIEKTALGVTHAAPGVVKSDELVATCREFAAIGIDHMLLGLPGLDELSAVETIGREVIPEVSEL